MSISSNRVKEWRHRSKERMVEAMGGKCQCCGYDTCKEGLAFHHIDPTQKELAFGSLRANPKTWTTVVEELKKCILVCHNCHSEIHAGVKEVPKLFAKFDESFADYKQLKSEYDPCPQCGTDKPKSNRFCSPKCAASNRRKVDWNSINVLELLEEHGITKLEEMLGVSNAAIYKQRNKILKEKYVSK
jgi:hypothetical protein